MWMLIVLVAIIAIGAIGCGASADPGDVADKSVEQANATVDKEVEEIEEPVEESSEGGKEDTPKEYQSALKKADIYANDTYMSKIALYDQLVSEYGEDFSEEAAQYAIDNVGANWKEMP